MKELTPWEPIHVECYSGGRFAERPVAFTWRQELFQGLAVKRAWQTPDGVAFLVRAADNRYFELAYTTSNDQWTGRQVTP